VILTFNRDELKILILITCGTVNISVKFRLYRFFIPCVNGRHVTDRQTDGRTDGVQCSVERGLVASQSGRDITRITFQILYFCMLTIS